MTMTTPGAISEDEAVTRAWPGVGWSAAAYHEHQGDQSPPHPADLYLAGAAGYRLDAAWVAIESELSPEGVRILKRLPTADYDLDDLWGDTRQKLIEDHPADSEPLLPDLPEDSGGPGRRPAKIIRYRGKVPLVNYLVLAARRLAISRKRQMVSRGATLSLSGGGRDEDEGPPQQMDASSPDPAQNAADREAGVKLAKRLRQALGELSPEQRFLIRMVYDRGMMQKDVGAMLGFSPFKTSRQMKDAMAKLGDALAEALEADASQAIKTAWEQAWKESWADEEQSLQVGADRAS